MELIGDFPGKISKKLDIFHFREALAEMMNLARLGNKYLTDSEPWKLIKTDEERVKTILNISLQISANLSILCEPFLPFTAEKLRSILDLPHYIWKNSGNTELIKAGHQLNKPVLLFKKVEDETIEKQMGLLHETKKQNQDNELKHAEAKEIISFDDWTKLDIRTGTIVEAEKVPKTKKLLKLTVDTGLDKRIVVSGIAENYKPEDIIGQKVSILINLAPRKLKGIESQGMILMAENNENKLCFIEPSEDFHDGSDIK